MTGRSSLQSEPAPTPGHAIRVRPATMADIAAVRAIYAHHVLTGTGSFEEDAPSESEMRSRFRAVTEGSLPYFVAVDTASSVVGFAYAAPFRTRSAYRYTVEDSVYVDPAALGKGIGRKLLSELVRICAHQGFRQMVAVIGDSSNKGSIALHAALAFRPAGTLHGVGCKFGQSLDVVFMQRPLGDGR
jgi:L-amino acid N-acyltransferase YncA